MTRQRTAAAVGLLLVLVTLIACSSDDLGSSDTTDATDSSGSAPEASDDGDATNETPLPALHAEVAEPPALGGIYDEQGREVLLRGVNLNALGDYYQGNPDHPATIPFEEADAERMAAQGFDVVRLIVSWSLVQPERGEISDEYIAEVREAVDIFAANDIYVILDMHQDAWGKFIASPDGADEECAEGSVPAIGWDGAPEWATLTDDATTCRSPIARELSPAVATAFESFWTDRDGIQEEFVSAWAALATEFAADPAVAGYDILNEPNPGLALDRATFEQRLAEFYQRTTEGIRAAEAQAGGFEHILFFEPSAGWPGLPARPLPFAAAEDNAVYAPHIYTGSLDKSRTVADGFAAAAQDAGVYGTTFLSGEWGWFGDPVELQAQVAAYALLEDQYLVGGTWWQWKQACGDPHAIGEPGGDAPDESIHYLTLTCPGDVDEGVTPEWATILTRAYPRAAPGRLTLVDSDPVTGALVVEGDGAESIEEGTADLWVPDRGQGEPAVTGDGIGEVDIREVDGGWRIEIVVRAPDGSYRIAVAGA